MKNITNVRKIEQEVSPEQKLVRIGFQYRRDFCPICMKVAQMECPKKHFRSDCFRCGMRKDVFCVKK
ncbi:MAG: hypothetical protein LBQ05_01930 [Christensenellaceae bacterium]|jgi:hypothetical protein|nr:hypothetical protein [Christensenellaceae bacterium]